MEKLYTRREAASMLGISLTSLDTARNTGAIAFIQYVPNGSVLLYRRSSPGIYSKTHIPSEA